MRMAVRVGWVCRNANANAFDQLVIDLLLVLSVWSVRADHLDHLDRQGLARWPGPLIVPKLMMTC